MEQDNTIPAVEGALSMMECLAECPKGASQAELKERLGLSMTTTYRILRTLLQRSWVSKCKSGTYVIGNGILPLVRSFSSCSQLLDKAKVLLRELSAEVDMACKLSIRRGNEQVTIGRAEPTGPYSLVSSVDSSFPVIEGSVGAALLADESAAAIQRIARGCLMQLPEKENPELILEGIASIKKKGYVLNMRPNRWNVAAMSVPLRDQGGSIVAAITLVGTVSDFTEESIPRLAKHLHHIVRSNNGLER